ncbi:MAG: four helix bundle protein [Acidobacteria bacterium]|nr:four helix bundle protein [Acidobacteriota bacterium]
MVEEASRKFPRYERFSLAQQLRDSSRSVVANDVES